MPADFRSHFFNAPISARVVLDEKLLGDATIVLSEDERFRLVNFTDVGSSEWPEEERARWLDLLSRPVVLGQCRSGCPEGLIAADYNLANAQLTLVSTALSQGAADRLWHALPKRSSSGLILSNQLSLAAGQKQSSAVGLYGGVEAAFGNWSAISEYQVDRSYGRKADTRHAVTSLYLMRETQRKFYRAGLFSPDSQGILRQPYLRGGGISTLAGVMTGSSDTLMKDGDAPALYPVWVTANRDGIAEVYRNGALINSQPVRPGLQALDTSPLPGGIYDVDIRIVEDGQETSRSKETINKPAGWRDPSQRLRYNLFAGQQTTLLNNTGDQKGKFAAGASLNYLLRPSLNAGVALQRVGKETQTGALLEWQANSQVMMYGNVWRSNVTGYGFDSQAIWTHEKGSVALNFGRSRYLSNYTWGRGTNAPARTSQDFSLSASYRINGAHTVNARLTRRSMDKGIGIDAGYSTYLTMGQTGVNLRFDAFDRPRGTHGGRRNRGVAITASFSPGTAGRSVSASIGSRIDARGSHDAYVSATLNQEWEDAIVRQSSTTITSDRRGAGISSYNQFDTSLASGSFWGQRSSAGGLLSGGVNLGSTVAVGQGKAALTRDAQQHQGGGMILDVVSDEADAALVAYHDAGATPLKAGRNFIPVPAWKPGTVRIDFPGSEAPALKASPQYLGYHLIRGGVSSHEVRVMKTVTVIGRLVDRQGRPVGGASLINHAGRTVTEADGMFTLELHEKNPVVRVEHPGGEKCDIRLDAKEKKAGAIIFAGNVSCRAALADSFSPN